MFELSVKVGSFMIFSFSLPYDLDISSSINFFCISAVASSFNNVFFAIFWHLFSQDVFFDLAILRIALIILQLEAVS